MDSDLKVLMFIPAAELSSANICVCQRSSLYGIKRTSYTESQPQHYPLQPRLCFDIQSMNSQTELERRHTHDGIQQPP